MKILAIVPAKEKSSRFPGKNRLLWNDAAIALLQVHAIDKIIIASDDPHILNAARICKFDTCVRTKAETIENRPLIDVLKHAYFSQKEEYTHIICVFGCTINVTPEDVESMIEKMILGDFQEVRSFSEIGEENGMFMLTRERLMEGHISSYIGCVLNGLKEIHREDQL